MARKVRFFEALEEQPQLGFCDDADGECAEDGRREDPVYYQGGGPEKTPGRLLLAILVVALLVLVAAVAFFAAKARREGFYTRYAREEPTRSYVPYTGTIPFGTWGVEPWALAFHPVASECSCPTPHYRRQGWTEGGGDMAAGYGWGLPPGFGRIP